MVIVSDCLTEKIDEGCLKVSNSLTKKIKQARPDTIVVSYDRKPKNSDVHLKLNKLFLNRKLFSLINKDNDVTLYIPFASNTKASALRVWILSRFTKSKIKVIFVLRFPMDKITKTLLKKSRAQIIALSKESYEYFNSEIGNAIYLKTGIDTKKFVPVNEAEKKELRKKYNVAEGKKVLLHVGHLKKGRNVDKLEYINDNFHVFLIASSLTEKERDNEIVEKLAKRANTTIIDCYLPEIQEIYQMADVYFFPVTEKENCIDIPLSVLEAAACNIPIVTTDYGELKEFKNQSGFYFLKSIDENTINIAINEACGIISCNNRDCTLEYDWDKSIEKICN